MLNIYIGGINLGPCQTQPVLNHGQIAKGAASEATLSNESEADSPKAD